METASPNPFVGVRQNGADAIFRGRVPNGVDDEDFGPETDVDMVDDVLLSPAIAAAKALVAGCHDVEDDLERQRQQLADFDDPADLDPSRDTPTPPAHEVASNANADPLAESGGEESEEEWNYIPGKDTKTDIDTQDQEDMSSQLNPNAAEFVPVSPTKLLMMDDAIISASPRMGFEKSMENVRVPSEIEFNDEVSRRPSDLGITNGPKAKHGDNYFMLDNFSTLRNKSPDLNSTSTCAQLGDDSIVSLLSSVNDSTVCASEDVPFDKLEALKNLNENKELLLDTDFSNNAFGVTDILDKHDHLTASEIEHELTQSPELEENLIPGTPKSTIVEAPVSPTNEEESPLNHETDLDSPTDDCLASPQKSSDVVSESALALGQDGKTSSSGFESDNGAEEGENNTAEDSNAGFVTEHRRSPPIDLSFKPIQTFSDTNPFGALQTPSSTTPLDHNEIITHINTETSGLHYDTPQKSSSEDCRQDAHLSFKESTPSFISARQKTPFDNEPVPFDELESPTEIPHFELPPNANSSVLAAELPTSPNPELNNFEEILSSNKEHDLESEIENGKSNHLHPENPIFEESSPKYEETSFTTDIELNKEAIVSSEDLDTTAGFLNEESKILNDEKDSEQSKPVDSEKDQSHIDNITTDNEPKLVDDFNAAESQFEPHPVMKDTDFESETKEMNLEFESHIPSQKTISEDLGNFDDGFEVINKDELKMHENNASNEHVKEKVNNHNLQSSELTENPFQQDDNLSYQVKPINPLVNYEQQLPIIDTTAKPEENKEESLASCETSVNNDFMNVFDSDSHTMQAIIKSPEKSEILSATLEPQVSKTESYQLLMPVNEPICTKTVVPLKEEIPVIDEIRSGQEIQGIVAIEEVGLNEITPKQEELCPKVEDNANLEIVPDIIPSDISLSKDEPVLAKSEPVESQVVTETLITALEETSEVPSLATTEVPSTAGTPPPTPIPTEADSKDEAKKTNLLVAAVAAAGAVATGAVLAVDKTKKEASKKPIAAVSKKSNDSTAKAPTKTALSKAPAAKPTTVSKTTTTKPATAMTKPATAATKPTSSPSKPATTTTGPKPPPTKLTSALTAAKKPAALTKPATAKPASASSPKPATSSAPKTVPKHLPVNKTAAPLKSTSKPTTPTSKPTTPTAPKSPSVMKTDVKSPARPAVKSTLTTSRPTSTAKSPAEDSVEKKSMTNGDVKPAVKKVADGVAKKPTTTTSKPLATTRPSAPVSKTAPATKAPNSAGAKPLASKPASSIAPKTKSSTTAATKPTVPPAIKRPTTGTAAKSADKTGKDIANKQLSNAKAVNGKVVPSKTVNSVKKTDAKINGKTADKLGPSKNSNEVHAENELPAVVQEDNVTTTNGFGEHDHIIEENGSMKIEELSPVILENVN